MEIVISYVWACVYAVMDVHIVYQFMTSFFEKRLGDKRLIMMGYGLRCITTVVLYINQPGSWMILPVSMVELLIITAGYRAKISKKVITAVLVFFLFVFAEAVTNVWIKSGEEQLVGNVELDLGVLGLEEYVLLWLLLIVLERFQNVKKNIQLPKTYIFLVIFMLCSSFALLMFIYRQEFVDERLVALALLFICVSIYALFYLYDSISATLVTRAQSKLLMREKMYYYKQSEIIQKNYESTRQFRHDMGNRMQVLKQMVTDGELDKVAEYIDGMAEKIEAAEAYSQTGNPAVDSILNYKLLQAEQKGIEVRYHIALPRNVGIEDDDMVSILGNLLDNAIEAVELMEENGYIDMNLHYEMGCIFLNIRNSYDSTIIMKHGHMQTRKKDVKMHGIGIKSVQSAVEKYQGVLEIAYDDKEFSADVLMYV